MRRGSIGVPVKVVHRCARGGPSFSSGFNSRLAHQCGDSIGVPGMLDYITSLIDKSLPLSDGGYLMVAMEV